MPKIVLFKNSSSPIIKRVYLDFTKVKLQICCSFVNSTLKTVQSHSTGFGTGKNGLEKEMTATIMALLYCIFSTFVSCTGLDRRVLKEFSDYPAKSGSPKPSQLSDYSDGAPRVKFPAEPR